MHRKSRGWFCAIVIALYNAYISLDTHDNLVYKLRSNRQSVPIGVVGLMIVDTGDVVLI
ncbi:MAG: hypothetical protein U9Q82_11780 [Chloroflexota bacterium]|nr:hypothetical protein [Chloroflexota bacterium]